MNYSSWWVQTSIDKCYACFVPDGRARAGASLVSRVIMPTLINVSGWGDHLDGQMISFPKSTFHSPNISLRILENFFVECVRQNSRGVASEGLNPNENWFCWDMAHITWHALSHSSALQRLHDIQSEYIYSILSIQCNSDEFKPINLQYGSSLLFASLALHLWSITLQRVQRNPLHFLWSRYDHIWYP